MSTVKQRKAAKATRPEQLANLTSEDRRRAVEGLSKKDFFRRLRTIKGWREERLARLAKDTR